ncbi:MAG TPA: hypothetical protein VFV05_08810 [Methylomirabilota bacterium]|nr:hypothetical protein [Methylomirabilota bacterium]
MDAAIANRPDLHGRFVLAVGAGAYERAASMLEAGVVSLTQLLPFEAREVNCYLAPRGLEVVLDEEGGWRVCAVERSGHA